MWFKKKEFGKQRKSTGEMIDSAVRRQNGWMSRRRAWAGRVLRRLGIFARPSAPARKPASAPGAEKKCGLWRVIRAYWFPFLCVLAVISMLIHVFLVQRCFDTVAPQPVPEPTIQPVQTEATQSEEVKTEAPAFDMVRIGKGGKIVIAGRWLPNHGVSVKINGEMVATEQTNDRGEFAYAPAKAFPAGNYVIRLSGVEQALDSAEDVFVYVSRRGEENSMSLLMAKDGSKFLQKPKLQSGDLVVSKIDYLENGRIVVQGSAIPRTRVSLRLDGRRIGMARVSDHKNFGIGANVGELSPGQEYTLILRMHDGSGGRAATIKHKFVMPKMQPGDDTWHTVRHGDSLWIIARNFLGRGIRYTLIVEKNNIKNPNLIHPKQKLQIPVKK